MFKKGEPIPDTPERVRTRRHDTNAASDVPSSISSVRQEDADRGIHSPGTVARLKRQPRSPLLLVNRRCARIGHLMPPRQARGQPLHPIYAPLSVTARTAAMYTVTRRCVHHSL